MKLWGIVKKRWHTYRKTSLEKQKSIARAKSISVFNRLIADPASGMSEHVARYASHMAQAHIMNWLDQKRIQHCRFCVETAPLKNHLDYKVCEKHAYMSVGNEQKVKA